MSQPPSSEASGSNLFLNRFNRIKLPTAESIDKNQSLVGIISGIEEDFLPSKTSVLSFKLKIFRSMKLKFLKILLLGL